MKNAIKNNLKKRINSYDDLEKILLPIIGDRKEQEIGKFEGKLEAALRTSLNKLISIMFTNDELWYFNAIVPPLSGSAGIAVLRNGEVVGYEVLIRS